MPSKEAQKRWNLLNREYKREKQKLKRHSIKEWLDQEIKKNKKCIECGESHIACLDFHHRDSNEKEIKLSEVHHKKWSKERILKEIEKCDILCSNCHRKFHWKERNHE